jgi:hypothetical protein
MGIKLKAYTSRRFIKRTAKTHKKWERFWYISEGEEISNISSLHSK